MHSRMFTTLTRTQARLRQAHERAQNEAKERLRNEAAAAVVKKSRSVPIDLSTTVMDENRNSVAAGSDNARTGASTCVVSDIEDVAGASAGFEPRYWRAHLENIRTMRAGRDAPVDTMGCERHMAEEGDDEKVKRYQTLLSLMLSSQTRDEVNHAAMRRLKDAGLASLDGILSVNEADLAELIKPVSFYKRKSEFIKATAKILRDKYAGEIPHSVKDLCQLPGVGPKMAHLVMLTAWEQCTGIAVDVHVHRICNRLGWVRTKTTDPIQTQKQIEQFIPKELWSEINLLFVGFGQTMCKAQRPNCGGCLNQQICPHALVNGN